MIRGLDHIAIAVNDLEAAVELWQRVIGAAVMHRETVSDQSVELVMLRIGSLKIELIHPVDEKSSVARFLGSRGEGIHHISMLCDSTQDELDRVRQAGGNLIDEVARRGAEDSEVGFVHPRSLRGVLLEFVERPESNE